MKDLCSSNDWFKNANIRIFKKFLVFFSINFAKWCLRAMFQVNWTPKTISPAIPVCERPGLLRFRIFLREIYLPYQYRANCRFTLPFIFPRTALLLASNLKLKPSTSQHIHFRGIFRKSFHIYKDDIRGSVHRLRNLVLMSRIFSSSGSFLFNVCK